MADAVIAFSSEVDTGSREENASKQESRASVLIRSEPLSSSGLRARITNFALLGTRLMAPHVMNANLLGAPAPALQQPVSGPAQARQCRFDLRVGKSRRWPAVNPGIGQPDHEKADEAGGGDVGKEVPAERHPQHRGYAPEPGRRHVSQRPPCRWGQRRGRVGPERGG